MVVTADDLSEDEVVASIENALAEELNLHPSDVEVSCDTDTGVVTYTITSDDAESLANVISDLGAVSHLGQQTIAQATQPMCADVSQMLFFVCQRVRVQIIRQCSFPFRPRPRSLPSSPSRVAFLSVPTTFIFLFFLC